MNNFLEVISLNDRANILYDVLKLVLELFDQEDNTYDVTVTSASPLSEEQKTRLLAIVSQKFEIKTRRLVEKIDEDSSEDSSSKQKIRLLTRQFAVNCKPLKRI